MYSMFVCLICLRYINLKGLNCSYCSLLTYMPHNLPAFTGTSNDSVCIVFGAPHSWDNPHILGKDHRHLLLIAVGRPPSTICQPVSKPRTVTAQNVKIEGHHVGSRTIGWSVGTLNSILVRLKFLCFMRAGVSWPPVNTTDMVPFLLGSLSTLSKLQAYRQQKIANMMPCSGLIAKTTTNWAAQICPRSNWWSHSQMERPEKPGHKPQLTRENEDQLQLQFFHFSSAAGPFIRNSANPASFLRFPSGACSKLTLTCLFQSKRMISRISDESWISINSCLVKFHQPLGQAFAPFFPAFKRSAASTHLAGGRLA